MSQTGDTMEWGLDLTEDLEIPGWLFVPQGLDQHQRAEWIASAQEEIERISDGNLGDSHPETMTDEVRNVLEWGLEERSQSPSLAVFQVWPMRHPTAVMCHINIVSSAELPSWAESEGVVHSIDAAHLGPGLQCSVKQVIWEDGQRFDLTSVHLVFDNGEVALMLSLDEAPAPLITFALPGLFILMDRIEMSRSDGVRFVSIPAGGVVEPGPWQLEENR